MDEQPTQQDVEFEAFDDEPIEQGSIRSEVTPLSRTPSPRPSGPETRLRRLRRISGRSQLVVRDYDEEDDWMHGPTSAPARRSSLNTLTCIQAKLLTLLRSNHCI